MNKLKQQMLKQKFNELKAMGATEVSFGSDFFSIPCVFELDGYFCFVIPKRFLNDSHN